MAPEIGRRVFRYLSHGLYIVTSRPADRLNGQIVNTVFQVTLDPTGAAVIINRIDLGSHTITAPTFNPGK